MRACLDEFQRRDNVLRRLIEMADGAGQHHIGFAARAESLIGNGVVRELQSMADIHPLPVAHRVIEFNIPTNGKPA